MIFNSNKPILPEPSDIAKEHSKKLINHIAELIESSKDKYIDFRTYMHEALYKKNLGYYVSGIEKLGSKGDFITSPEISSLFGYTIASSLRQILQDNPEFNILEFGAGSGKLACDILDKLSQLNALPEKYFILDVSPDLKEKQLKSINQLPKALQNKVVFLDTLPDSFNGVIIANEVIDAMPVNLFELDVQSKKISELGLILKNNKLEISKIDKTNLISRVKEKILPSIDIDFLKTSNVEKYLIEYNHDAELWIETISKTLNSGIMYLIDYGFNKAELYHSSRYKGTLQCHFQHHSNPNPLWYPGLQDITTHVDFNNIAEIAYQNECDIESYISQGHFLVLNEIQKQMDEINLKEIERLKLSQEIKKLTLPHEMGDIFKFLIISKNIEKDYFLNLSTFDKKHSL